jgi:Tfp pilus assembly protein PilO
MKQSYTSKTDKTVRIIVILAVVAIALGVGYTYYLHSIGQFGN